MKRFLFVLFWLCLFTTLLAQSVWAQNYVTIGAFKVMDNAVKFTNKANRMNFQAQYALNPAKKLYYVFLLQTDDDAKAYSFLMKLRVESEFKDAWIFRGPLGIEQVKEKMNPPVVVQQAAPMEEPKEESIKEEPKKEEPVVVEQPKQEQPPAETPKPSGKPFYFKMVNAETGNPVMGEVHVLESAKASDYVAFVGNQVVYLPPPKNNSAIYQVETLAPGYREMKRPINYANPGASAAEVGSDQEFVIALPLVRVKAGDYIEFSNVRFFQNSAILQPEAKNELDGLAALLKENGKYKVVVHGHCNGNEDRDVVSKGTSTEFFATSINNKRERASAKVLSQLRADLVRDYLISQGVDGSRMKTKGDAGKEYLYPKNSTLSARNDRVEIEIKKSK